MTEPDRPVSLGSYALTQPSALQRRNLATPWKAGYEIDEAGTGTITTGPTTDDSPVWNDVFAYWQLNPNDFEIVGDVTANAWEGPSAEGTVVYRQFKARIRRRTATSVPVDDFLLRLARWRPSKRPKPERSPEGAAFVVVAADWQVGGEPADSFIGKFEVTLSGLVRAARAARADGCDRFVVIFAGDMVEGTTGNYSSQSFTVGASGFSLRDMVRIVRQCETLIVRRIAPLFASTTAVALPGNHGRNAPKVTTRPDDNMDLLAFEQCAEVLRASGFADEYDVTFVGAEPAGVVTVDAAGFRLACAHGDQVSGSADRVRDYWRRIAFTRHGDSDIADALVTGHRHHFRCEELADGRWMFVAPTLGTDSAWYTESGGGTSRPGTLTFRCASGEGGPRWWGLDIVGTEGYGTGR